jgi:hypothetical protein
MRLLDDPLAHWLIVATAIIVIGGEIAATVLR